jgi:hypothetical protein
MTNTQTLQRKGGNSIRKHPDVYKLLQIAVLSKKKICRPFKENKLLQIIF